MFRSRAMRKVEEAGYDPDRLPPGQYLTEKWPVLHAGTVPNGSRDLGLQGLWRGRARDALLGRVHGAAHARDHDRHPLRHALEPLRHDLQGRPLERAREVVKPKPSARYVVAHAEQDFTANVPLAALEDEEALLAYEADGEPLTPEHGWPLRLVIPKRYFWKSAKWLRGIELLDHDEPGSGSASATTRG